MRTALFLAPSVFQLLEALENDWDNVSASPLFQSFTEGHHPTFAHEVADPSTRALAPQLFAMLDGPDKVKKIVKLFETVIKKRQTIEQTQCFPKASNCSDKEEIPYWALLQGFLRAAYLFGGSLTPLNGQSHFINPAQAKFVADMILDAVGTYQLIHSPYCFDSGPP